MCRGLGRGHSPFPGKMKLSFRNGAFWRIFSELVRRSPNCGQSKNYSKSADNHGGMDTEYKQYASCLTDAYPSPQRPSKLSGSASILGTTSGKSWVDGAHPSPLRGDAPRAALFSHSTNLISSHGRRQCRCHKGRPTDARYPQPSCHRVKTTVKFSSVVLRVLVACFAPTHTSLVLIMSYSPLCENRENRPGSR